MKDMNKKISKHHMLYIVIAVLAAAVGAVGTKVFLESQNAYTAFSIASSISSNEYCASSEKVTELLSDLYKTAGYTVKNISVRNTGRDGVVCWYNVVTYVEMYNTTYKTVLKVPVVGEYIIMRGISLDNTPLELKIEKSDVLFKPVKTERPKVDLYIMSMCPFGIRAFEELYKFYDATRFFDVEPIFIVGTSGYNETICEDVGVWYNGKCYTSLHGKEELLIDIVLYNIYRKHGFDTFSKVYMKFIEALESNTNTDSTKVYELFKSVLSEEGYNIEEYMDLSVLPIFEQNTILKGITASPTTYVNGVRIPYNPVQEPNKVYGVICASTTKDIPECDGYIKEIELAE